MKTTILPALRLLLVLTVITGVAYPLLMTVFASAAFNDRAAGRICTYRIRRTIEPLNCVCETA